MNSPCVNEEEPIGDVIDNDKVISSSEDEAKNNLDDTNSKRSKMESPENAEIISINQNSESKKAANNRENKKRKKSFHQW